MSILPRIKLALTGLYWRYWHPRKRVFLSLALVVAGAVLLVYGPAVFAAGETGTYASPMSIKFVPSFLLDILSRILLLITRLFLSLSMFILSFIIEIGSYNGYLSSSAVTIGWVTVRDITNMGFVIILLIIAFGTILGLEQYEWKKLLVKFVMAAILVNFSRIICGIIIDIAQVVMITFVNGIAATAGGNLINAFNLNDIQKLTAEGNTIDFGGVFIASVAAITFSAMVMATMAVFLAMLLARMVVLWVLIVLSPLAFVLSVVPQTQKYASEWWSEFGSNVVTGPVLLFFLWLSFVTVGSGNVHQQIADNAGGRTLNEADAVKSAGADVSSGITEAMKWNNMANFAIAIGMLIVGAKAAQQLGGVGGAWAGGAIDFGKKVATVASGVAAARWAGGKAKEGALVAGKGLAKLAYHVSPAASYVERIKNRALSEWEGFQARRYAPQSGLTPKEKWVEEERYGDDVKDEQGKLLHRKGDIKREGRFVAEKYKEDQLDAEGKILHKKGDTVMQEIPEETSWIMRRFQKRASIDMESAKKLEKTKKFAETRKESLSKDIRGVPTSVFMRDWEKVDALDRREQGKLEEKKARSAAKTKQFGGEGKLMEASTRRRQIQGGELLEAREETLAEEIAGHEVRGHLIETEMGTLGEEAKGRFLQTVEGHAIEVKTNLAEQAKKAAEDIVKTLKEGDLKGAFNEAAKAIEDVMDRMKNDPKKVTAELQKLVSINPYVAALATARELSETTHEKGVREKQAVDASFDAVVGLHQGSRTQSSAMSEETERAKKEYSILERVQAQKLAADRLAFLMQKRQETERQGGEFELRDQIALTAALGAVDVEAWNDDVMDHIFDQIKALDSGAFRGRENSVEGQKAAGMKELGEKLGWKLEIDQTTGKKKIVSTYGRGMSAQLQNLGAFGGDADAVRANTELERRMKENKSLTYGQAIQAAAGDGTLGMTPEAYMKKLRAAQDFLQTGARVNTQNAYGTGHYESAHNIQFDVNLEGGMLRPMTTREAQAETIADLNKKGQDELSKSQIHSVMEMDMNSHLPQHIIKEMFQAVYGQMQEEYQYTKVPQRSARKLWGYGAGETIRVTSDGFAQIGNQAINETYGAGQAGTDERGRHIIKDYLLPQILGGIKPAIYGMRSLFNNVSLDEANAGVIKVNVDGAAFGKITNLRDLLNKIESDAVLKNDILRQDPNALKELAELIAKAAIPGSGLGLQEKKGKGDAARKDS